MKRMYEGINEAVGRTATKTAPLKGKSGEVITGETAGALSSALPGTVRDTERDDRRLPGRHPRHASDGRARRTANAGRAQQSH